MAAAARADGPLEPHREAAREAVVYVAGAVMRGGVYRLREGARVDDAVRAAGGLSPAADARAVNLAAQLADGEEIDVKTVAEAGACAAGTAAGPRASNAHGRRRRRTRPPAYAPAAEAAPPATSAVDLNAATAADLAALPGISAALAARIVAFRAVNGRFTSLDDLLDVSGVSQRQLDRLAAFVSVR
jgi:competence protein ComEA